MIGFVIGMFTGVAIGLLWAGLLSANVVDYDDWDDWEEDDGDDDDD